jgi:hypothetical protein
MSAGNGNVFIIALTADGDKVYTRYDRPSLHIVEIYHPHNVV